MTSHEYAELRHWQPTTLRQRPILDRGYHPHRLIDAGWLRPVIDGLPYLCEITTDGITALTDHERGMRALTSYLEGANT